MQIIKCSALSTRELLRILPEGLQRLRILRE
jgi:hypothetical protein